MKIGIVFDDTLDSTDGVQQYIKTIARWLIKNGHDVRFLVGESYDTTEFKDRVFSLSKNMTVKGNQNTMSLPYMPMVRKILQVIEKEKFDLLHVQMPYSPFMAQIIMAIADVPKVGTFHTLTSNQLITLGFNLLSVIQKSSLESFSRIFTVSEPAKKFAEKHFGINNAEILPNVVDLALYQKVKPLNKYKDGKVNIFFLGRLVERKGVIYLLQAYKKVLESIDANKVRLIIGGKGDLKKELESYAKKNKLKNVVFEGYIPEELKQSYLADADITVFPSIGGESFGIVLLEAMAAGKPVIAGANVGYKTVLKGKGSLLLVNPKDIDIFAEKLKVLIEDKALRESFGKWGIEEVRKYSVEKIGKQLLEIYKDVLKKDNSSKKTKLTGLNPVKFVYSTFRGLVSMIFRFLIRASRIEKN